MDNKSLAWGLAFAYMAYAALGDIPALASYAVFSIEVSSLLFVLLYLYHSYTTLGARSALKYFVITTLLGYSFEYLFINTGWIGQYSYTGNLAPFIGPVPLFIPLLWASLSYFCMLSSDNYAVAAVLMVLLDVSFDPRFSLTLWHWESATQYFGVPITNFVGWFITAATIYGVFYLVTKRKPRSSGKAITFYLLVALVNGAIPELVPGLYTAGEISIVLFAGTVTLLYVYSHRLGPFRMDPRVKTH